MSKHVHHHMCLCTHMHTYLYSLCLQSAQNRLLIKNGKVVNEDGMVDSDVYIEDGIIK
jgi:dihydropyrimidinase